MNKKLTVLYVCVDSTMGGSTASLWDLIQSVKDEVYPIVLFPKEGVGFDFYREHGIECYIYPFNILHLFRENRLVDVWKHPWRWHYIKKLRYDYGCVWFAKKILNGRTVDIVHTNTTPNDVGVLLSQKLHAKHIWHIRECMDIHSRTEMYGGYEKLFRKVRKADAVIAISHFIQQHYKLPERNTFVINDAIRSQSDICYISPKELYILFSSYFLTKEKGTGWAIDAFEKSGLANDGYVLKLMGNVAEKYEDELMKKIYNCSCSQSIELVSCQANVKPFFEKASAYVMASDFEGLGRVTAEAMFFGCPVIARNTGGTVDIVKDGETGYLFDTVDECASLLRKVCLTDQTDMILRAQHFACENLSQEVYGPKIMEVYRKVMGEKQRRF